MEIYGQLYNQLYDLDIIGLRFFTVYGPDMSPYKFMNSIKNEEIIYKYGKGDSFRDYTYVTDIVQGIVGEINSRKGGFEVYNLGNGNPITLNEFISTCEKVSGKTAKIKEIENQQGDVQRTYADINKVKKDLGYNPTVKLEEGLNNVLCKDNDKNDKKENNKNDKKEKVRNYGGIVFKYLSGILENCLQSEFHNCYPVKDCEKHEVCKK